MSGCRIFIGRLSPHARERDVEKFFKGYGRIREINLKNGFGFVVSLTLCFVWVKRSSYNLFLVSDLFISLFPGVWWPQRRRWCCVWAKRQRVVQWKVTALSVIITHAQWRICKQIIKATTRSVVTAIIASSCTSFAVATADYVLNVEVLTLLIVDESLWCLCLLYNIRCVL